jgi:hypothetical protein
MPDRSDDRIRALVVELVDNAPAAPSLQEIQDRGAALAKPHRHRGLLVGAIAVVSVALIVGIVMARVEDRSGRVRAGEPATTSTAPNNQPLRLRPTVLPTGFVESPARTDAPNLPFTTDMVVGATGTATPSVPTEVVQSAVYVRGTSGQSDYGGLTLVVWRPTAGSTDQPSSEQIEIGDRTVALNRVQTPTAVAPVNVIMASWREAGYAVSVLATGITDAELHAFIGGLRAI